MPRARLKQSPKPEPVGGPKPLRRLLLLPALLCALAAVLATPGVARQPPRISLSARPESVTLCPDRPTQVRLFLGGVEGSFEYRWRVEAGRLKSDGAVAFWDLSGVGPGTYTATVTVTPNSLAAVSRGVRRAVKVVVRECPEAATPACPDIKLDCPPSIVEGGAAVLTAEVGGGGQPRGGVSYLWAISPDAPATRDGRRVKIDTSGLGGQTLVTTFEVTGYGVRCAERCRTSVEPRPTPTPSPAASPTSSPTASPTLTPSPTPAPPVGPLSPTPDASPSTSPGPSPSSSPTPAHDSGLWRLLAQSSNTATLLFILGALALLAAIAFGLYKLSDGARHGGSPFGFGRGAGTWPEEHHEAEAEAGGGFVGGETDELQCTVYAPFGAAPGEGFLVQAFAHLGRDIERLAGLAREAQQNAERRGARALGAVARGQELGFQLQMPGLEVDDPSQSIVWRGEVETVQFGVSVPEDFRPRAVACKLTVTSGSVPLGHIRFTLNVAEADAPPHAPDASALARHRHFVRYRQAFISYASEDRAEVLRCVQMLTLLKIECFQDVLSLGPGERWRESLYRKIESSDVLFLFWSAAASRSVWVEKEVRYALELKAGDDGRPPEIVPVILEGPPAVSPPDYLPELHFNDPFAYFIRAEAAMRRDAKEA